jgi:hypothetical protein
MKQVAIVLALLSLVATAHAARPQVASKPVASYQTLVTSKLAAIANYLELQVKKGNALHAQLQTTKSQQISDLLKKTSSGDNAIAKLEQTQGRNNFVATIDMPVGSEPRKQVVVHDVLTNSQSVAAYASYVRKLSGEIKTARPDQISEILRTTYVPAEIAIILNPDQLPGMPPPVPSSLSDYIVGGGGATVDYPAVAAILYPFDAGGVSTSCTGTLIAPNAILTAAHCIVGASPEKVYFQHAGMFAVDGVTVNEHYVPASSTTPASADLGIIFLKPSVSGIVPLGLNDVAAVQAGTSGVIVGYGWRSQPLVVASTGGGDLIPKPGIKVYATTTTSTCATQSVGRDLICWTYPGGTRVDALGSTCFGDSGGPFAVQVQGTWRLAGLTSGGSQGSKACRPGDNAYDMEVYNYVGWIRSRLKVKLGSVPAFSMRPLQPLYNYALGQYIVDVGDRPLDASGTTWSTTVTLDAGTKLLRIGVNATPTGNPLKLQATPTSGSGNCALSVIDSAVFCSPTIGATNWTISVAGSLGQEIQVVATEFRAQ